MRRLNLEERTLVVKLYRQFKENPKTFALTDDEYSKLMDIVDVMEFDIYLLEIAPVILYGNYSTGSFLTDSDKTDVVGETQGVNTAIHSQYYQLAIQTLREIRNGKNLPREKIPLEDGALVVASYIHLGIAHLLIPLLNSARLRSEAYVKLQAEIIDNQMQMEI